MNPRFLKLLADFEYLVRERVHIRVYSDGTCELCVLGMRPQKYGTWWQMVDYMRQAVEGDG